MELKSNQIPKSYQSYLDTFETDPKNAIERLRKRVNKRNSGAVGYFFLALLYAKAGDKEKALEAAMNAKVMAPGSELMNRLHYFISHPRSFEAWQPYSRESRPGTSGTVPGKSHPIQDLDLLITKLSGAGSKRITPVESDEEQPDLSDQSSDVDDIVTETLAVIHEKQNNYPAAIKTYQQLKRQNPSRSDHYNKKIEKLNERIAEEKED